MKICSTCVLPETFPGITFAADGRCSYCERYGGKVKRDQGKERFRKRFIDVLDQKRNTGPYDVLVAYSGGKDSTHTLRVLKEEFSLKILAITFDHGFVSETALVNIRTVTENLDIDHMAVRPGGETLNTVFTKSMAPNVYPIKALERASSICNSCMNLVKSFLLKKAIEMRVPMIAYGWSPGQAPVQSSVFKTNSSMIRQMQKAMRKPIEHMIGDRLSSFFLEDRHFETDVSLEGEKFPYLVHPLAFLDYSEERILAEIKGIGWVDPKDTDANSTNCLLNSFANEVHMKQLGFHPYAFEIAGLVREGYMTRQEGLKRLSVPPDPDVVKYVQTKLGIPDL